MKNQYLRDNRLAYENLMLEAKNYAVLCATDPDNVQQRHAFNQLKVKKSRHRILNEILDVPVNSAADLADILEIIRLELQARPDIENLKVLDRNFDRLIRILRNIPGKRG